MALILSAVIIIAITIGPVMVAAKMLHAGNSGFFSCLIAVVLASVAGNFIFYHIGNTLIALVAAIVAVGLIYSLVLSARFVQSLCIALLAVAIQYATIFLIGILGLTAMSGIH